MGRSQEEEEEGENLAQGQREEEVGGKCSVGINCWLWEMSSSVLLFKTCL